MAQHADAVGGGVAAQHGRVGPTGERRARRRPEGAGQVVGVRELEERHLAELLHGLAGQAGVQTWKRSTCRTANWRRGTARRRREWPEERGSEGT